MLKLNLQNCHFMTVHFWHNYISIKDGKRSFPIINKVMTFTKCVHGLTVPAREGRWEGKGRKERNHLIIYHQAFLKQNMQHFPFIRTNSDLCLGTVQPSPAWMEVSILLIVTVLLLEAYRLPINIILLTVRGVVSVGHVKFFQNRLFSSSRQSEWMGHLCRTGGHLHLCVFRTNVYDWDWQFACADKLMCTQGELRVCRFVNDMRWEVKATNNKAELQNDPHALLFECQCVLDNTVQHTITLIYCHRKCVSFVERDSTEQE